MILIKKEMPADPSFLDIAIGERNADVMRWWLRAVREGCEDSCDKCDECPFAAGDEDGETG